MYKTVIYYYLSIIYLFIPLFLINCRFKEKTTRFAIYNYFTGGYTLPINQNKEYFLKEVKCI